MTNYLRTVIVLLISALTGCTTMNCGNSHPYAKSVAIPPLKAPPGLSVPAPDPNYAIEGLGEDQTKDAANAAKGTCLVKPPQLINSQAPSASNPEAPSGNGSPEPATPITQPSVTPGNKKTTLPATSTTALPPTVAGSWRVE